MDDKAKSSTMWGGRFAAGPDAIMEAINASIGFDRRLAAEDIAASRAHAAMLAAAGIVSDADAAAIREGLLAVLAEIEAGGFAYSTALEDIHMNVESRLKELVGEPAGRLHTARSRNDQVATDFRLWVRGQCDAVLGALTALMRALLAQAEAGAGMVMPGFTHLQVAQPVTWGHHMLAYVEMLDRDRGRFRDARARMNESPLGAAALAGTSFPIDREATAAALGFDRPMANSLDAVSDRDFALEFLGAAAICATHLSRQTLAGAVEHQHLGFRIDRARQFVAAIEPARCGRPEGVDALVNRVAAELVNAAGQHRPDERRHRMLRLADRQGDRRLSRRHIRDQLVEASEWRARVGQMRRGWLAFGWGHGHACNSVRRAGSTRRNSSVTIGRLRLRGD
jgi:hypothetical protein